MNTLLIRTVQGNRPRGYLVATLAVVLIAGPDPASAAEELPTGQILLSKLRLFDAAFLSKVTLTGQSTLNPGVLDVAFDPTPVNWTLTIDQDGKTLALSAETVTVPQVSPSALDEWHRRSGEPQTVQPVLEVRRTLYAGVQHNGEVLVVAHIDQAGKAVAQVDESKLEFISQIYPANNHSLDLPIKKIFWTVGRGYANQIDEIVEVKLVKPGLISATALGRGLGTMSGTWHLEIEPDAGYIVRAATFTSTGRATVQIKTTNDGMTVTGAHAVPVRATWKEIDGNRESVVEVKTIKEQPDVALLDQAKVMKAGPFPGPSSVLDYVYGSPYTVQLRPNVAYKDPVKAVAAEQLDQLKMPPAAVTPEAGNKTTATGTYLLLSRPLSVLVAAGGVIVAGSYLLLRRSQTWRKNT